MDAAADLKTPIILLAMPQVADPFFHKGVVLLLAHEEAGSFGFVINRQTGLLLSEVLKGLELAWGGDASAYAFVGGPVQPQLGTVLFGTGTVELGRPVSEILPGVGISQHLGDLETLAKSPPPAFKLLLGYAGWGAGQLVEEILRNDWLTAPATPDLVFATDPGQIWDAALRRVGIDPASLPSWTLAGDDTEAN
ncbi:MAG: YqgE/AlgH family protein [Acidobacteriota bacterium]